MRNRDRLTYLLIQSESFAKRNDAPQGTILELLCAIEFDAARAHHCTQKAQVRDSPPD